MDFFARQDSARKFTTILTAYFGLAVALTILLVYCIPVLAWHAYKVAPQSSVNNVPFVWWYPQLFSGICGITLMVVLGGATYKIAQLRRGGGRGVATMLGGRAVLPSTDDFFERRLYNVVEEMAIASGVPVPPVFVMERESGINAFAAGFDISDAVVAVTHGAMTGLTRDELQGVIAHEFSHILNRDMMLNINLMGMLHGLLVIGLTGRVLITEFAFRDSIGRSGRDTLQITLLLMALGLCLLIAGFTGYIFCKMIKASISRARERLADASAVQFTRNPKGLASALCKIGGLAEGSRIRSPYAEQTSHMFFGNGLRGSVFSTHPPLRQRIAWLDPSFDGSFPVVTYESLREQLTRFEGAPKKEEKKKGGFTDLFTNPMGVMGAALVTEAVKPKTRPISPHALLESIGQPMEHHAEAARELIQSIPETIREYAADPYGARMLIYFLLLDKHPPTLKKQMSILQKMAETEVYQIVEKALSKLGGITPEQRLPIVDLSIPALRFLSLGQYKTFIQVVRALIEADDQVDIFEYALQRVLTHHLNPLFEGKVRRMPANYYSIRGLFRETSILLSILARKGHDLGTEAAGAFLAATELINEPSTTFQMIEPEHGSWENLDAALDKLNEASAQLKKLILSAALTCMMHDREIAVEEVELFRAIADTLGCPVPPWVTPAELS
jgi:Zn-dependent protease with chaperone function